MLRLYVQSLMEVLCEKKEYEENDKWYTDLFEVRQTVVLHLTVECSNEGLV